MSGLSRESRPLGVTLRRIVVLLATLAAVSFTILVVNQTLQLAAFAATLHPTAGTVVLWGLVVVYVVCAGVPVYLWLRMPPPLVPPVSMDDPAFDAHLQRLGRRLAANRHLAGAPPRTREEIARAIEQLDERADVLIRSSGARVFITTAISQYGALDALMVLGLQVRLVWDVAHVYQQRPSLRDLTTLYANVAGTAFLAGQLDDAELSEYVQPLVSSVLGSATGIVPGLAATSTVLVQSIVSGAANTFLALRVGVMAQEYSRGLVRPQRGALRGRATARAARMLGTITANGATRVSAAIARGSGRTVATAVTGLGRKVKQAGSALTSLGRRGQPPPEPE